MIKKNINGLSLFSNVGISEIRMNETNFQILLANEIDPKRCELYSKMHPYSTIINGDITNADTKKRIITKAKELDINFLLITPPCQGMSLAGKGDLTDTRNYLLLETLDIVNSISPDIIIIENVPSLFKIQYGKSSLLKYFYSKLNSDYVISENILNSSDYGVAQSRKRAIIVLTKNGYSFTLPQKEKLITVRDTISHLPSLESGQSSSIKYHVGKIHSDSHILAMKHTPTGKSAHDNIVFFPKKKDGTKIKGYSTTYKRIEWDQPSPTITMANGSISSQNNVHPGRKKEDGTYSDSRVLSLLEIMLLSSIPDNFFFPEGYSESFLRKVIGEGIPPLFLNKILLGINHED